MKKILLMGSILIGSMLNAQTIVSGDITANTTWTNNNIYMLTGGFVYVTNNATLTIQPGTIIKGSGAALVITRGAKIIANGTASQPIIMTSTQPAGSRAPGDWGGLLVLGKATINDPAGERLAEGGIDATKGLYGGTNDTDSSGVIRYVRIEYAGIAFQPNSETNGLTMGGVGSKTLVEYVQVSHGGDDAFEFFGGTVNAKYLVAHMGLDDDFDTDFGYRGKLQFVVALRDSNVADISGSNGFESDNDGTGTTNNPITKPIFSNVSIFGPKINSGTVINSNYKRALHLRRSTKTSTYNSVFTGYPTGLKIEGSTTATNATNGELQFKNNVLAGMVTPLDSSALVFDMKNWYNSNGNTTLTNSTDVMVTNPYNYKAPSFLPQIGSPLLTGASFTGTNISDPYFTPVTHRGAFGLTDWTANWTNFDPQSDNYALSVKDESALISKAIVYPNPSENNATISLSLTEKEMLNVSLVNIQGQQIKTILNDNLNAGSHSLNVNLDEVSTGIYFIKIQSATTIKTLKLVVIK